MSEPSQGEASYSFDAKDVGFAKAQVSPAGTGGKNPLILSPSAQKAYDSLMGRVMSSVDEIRFPTNDKEAVEAAEVLLRTSAGLKNDEHGKDTPKRFVEMLKELTTAPEIKWKTFPNDGMDEMIVVRDIPFHSLCNHHVVPFIGIAHIGYVPGEVVAGLSKFARVVKHFAAGLQVQERLTMQVADFLQEHLQPRGVAVAMEAEHLCMTIRGVQSPGTRTYTAAMLGVFNDHTRTAKLEFMSRINGGHNG